MSIEEKDQQFRNQLDVFNEELMHGFKSIFLYFMVELSPDVSPLNKYPNIWSLCIANAVGISVINLGKIFDDKSCYSLNRLIKIVEKSIDIFSFKALESRKSSIENLDFEEYIQGKTELSVDDVRALRKQCGSLRSKYLPHKRVRDKFFAHREVLTFLETGDASQKAEAEGIFQIYVELYNIWRSLWERYQNGRVEDSVTVSDFKNCICKPTLFENPILELKFLAKDYNDIYKYLEVLKLQK